MIFKTLLKYKIFEWCMDTLFEKIVVNFSRVITGTEMRIGEHFSEIIYYCFDEYKNLNEVYRYYDCKILTINKSIIKFNYMRIRESPLYKMYEGYGISACYIDSLEFKK